MSTANSFRTSNRRARWKLALNAIHCLRVRVRRSNDVPQPAPPLPLTCADCILLSRKGCTIPSFRSFRPGAVVVIHIGYETRVRRSANRNLRVAMAAQALPSLPQLTLKPSRSGVLSGRGTLRNASMSPTAGMKSGTKHLKDVSRSTSWAL